jgi:hypothetical protein
MTATIETLSSLPQGDVRLIEHPVAQRLLGSDEVARMAFVAKDGTPRVIPIAFHWNGTELVMATFAGVTKVRMLRANPNVALTIDVKGVPPEMLMLRGKVEITEVSGILPEYVLIQRRYYGEERAASELAKVDHPDLRMVRIALRPAWVGVIDFRTRLPGATTRDEFIKIGRS